ncbi:hypothetical protein QBC43DRAFT_290283 [Cladorrhinum sp. PSN259]|nr:hypothetical protein QBC43DRAFT_290283 [Cladorrhinum sp. PSN259]
MSRSVRWGSDSPAGGSHYDHQPSDSGVGSFSDCESRMSNPDGTFVDYDGQSSTYNLQRALETTRAQRDDFAKKVAELEAALRQVRNEFEQTKAHMRAVTENNELLTHEKDTLTQKNKELAEENIELKEKLDDTVGQLKKANRKSTSQPTVTIVAGSSASNSDSSEDKKVRRSSSKRRPEKEKERDAEREKEKEKERREKERKKERHHAKETREKEPHIRDREKPEDDIDRLRNRFVSRAGEESDAKSSTVVSSRTRTSRRDSYIEPMGNPAPRPQPTPSSSSTRHHSYTGNSTYAPSAGYASIREPSNYAANTPRSAHPQVYVASEYTGYPEEEETGYHGHTVARPSRPRV